MTPGGGEGLTGAGLLLFASESRGDGQASVPASLRRGGFPFGDGKLFIGQAVRHGTQHLGAGGHNEQEYLQSLNAIDQPGGFATGTGNKNDPAASLGVCSV